MKELPAFIYILLGIALFSGILYVILKSYARHHPDGLLAQPHAVRDVWLSVIGGFISVAGLGLLFLIMDVYKPEEYIDVSSYYLFTLVGGIFMSPMFSVLVARYFYMRQKESVLQDISVYRTVLFSIFGGVILLLGIVILIFWLYCK